MQQNIRSNMTNHYSDLFLCINFVFYMNVQGKKQIPPTGLTRCSYLVKYKAVFLAMIKTRH